jgi:hypothetical protein
VPEKSLRAGSRGYRLPRATGYKSQWAGKVKIALRAARSAIQGPGYLELSYSKEQMKDAPSIRADGEPPAGGEEAIFKDYGMTFQAALAASAAGPPLSSRTGRRIR